MTMAQYRFHILGFPNSQSTSAYSLDGFQMCTIRFCRLLKSLGHTVYLYASEENEAPVDELITVITKEEIETLIDGGKYQCVWIDGGNPLWQLSTRRARREIAARIQPHDFICGITGSTEQYIADAFPQHMFVEYSIGYQGCFSRYRVYESHAWRHAIYGQQGIGLKDEDCRFFDDVIPCFFDPAEFPFCEEKDPFLLYVGRILPRKGVDIAFHAAREAGVPLKVIGFGDLKLIPPQVEYLGELPLADRNTWMSRAQAVLCPTTYLEPFCCVSVEAQLCGTPVISTNWGGFTENVLHGVTGFRCDYLGEFIEAIQAAPRLSPHIIRARAEAEYSIAACAPRYQRYFDRLALLWTADGWMATKGVQDGYIHSQALDRRKSLREWGGEHRDVELSSLGRDGDRPVHHG